MFTTAVTHTRIYDPIYELTFEIMKTNHYDLPLISNTMIK